MRSKEAAAISSEICYRQATLSFIISFTYLSLNYHKKLAAFE